MNQFYLIALMVYANQRDMDEMPITFVLNALDKERTELRALALSREDFLELDYAEAMEDHFVRGWSFGWLNKYLENEQFSKPALPF